MEFLLVMMCFININHPEWGEECELMDTEPGYDAVAFCAAVNDGYKEFSIAEEMEDIRLIHCREYNHNREHARAAHRFPVEVPVLYCMDDIEGYEYCAVHHVSTTISKPIVEHCEKLYQKAAENWEKDKPKDRLRPTTCRAYNPDTDAGRL